MAINCSCDDATGYRTLAQLRADLLARLGFADPMANVATRTLQQLRTDLMVRLGFAAQAANPPPGMTDLLDSFSNEAQQTLFRRLELDNGAVALPARMTANTDQTTLDYVPVFNLALALAKSHYGKPDAKVYFEIVEKYIADTVKRRPPNITAYLTGLLQDAQRQVLRRYPALRMDRWFSWSMIAGQRFYDLPNNDEATQIAAPANLQGVADDSQGNLSGVQFYKVTAYDNDGETTGSDTALAGISLTFTGSVILTWDPVVGAKGYRVYGRGDGVQETGLGLIADVTTTTYVDIGEIEPGVQIPQENTTASCTKQMDPLQIKWVGITSGNARYPISRGIPPQVLDYEQTSSRPTHYEVKQCIEVWPAPADSLSILRMRAGFVPTAFSSDSDRPSIDDELVFLYALANAKMQMKQNDAQAVFSEFEVALAGVVAGSHGAKRYVPGANANVDYVYVQPVPSVPFS